MRLFLYGFAMATLFWPTALILLAAWWGRPTQTGRVHGL